MNASAPVTAHQGERYLHNGRPVLALETGEVVFVRELDPSEWLGVGQKYVVRAEWLRPAPMKYYNGQLARS